MIEFGYALKRLSKVTKTVEQLIERNQDLVTANDKLRKQLETYDAREVARERIIQDLEKQLNGREVVPTSEDIHP